MSSTDFDGVSGAATNYYYTIYIGIIVVNAIIAAIYFAFGIGFAVNFKKTGIQFYRTLLIGCMLIAVGYAVSAISYGLYMVTSLTSFTPIYIVQLIGVIIIAIGCYLFIQVTYDLAITWCQSMKSSGVIDQLKLEKAEKFFRLIRVVIPVLLILQAAFIVLTYFAFFFIFLFYITYIPFVILRVMSLALVIWLFLGFNAGTPSLMKKRNQLVRIFVLMLFCVWSPGWEFYSLGFISIVFLVVAIWPTALHNYEVPPEVQPLTNANVPSQVPLQQFGDPYAQKMDNPPQQGYAPPPQAYAPGQAYAPPQQGYAPPQGFASPPQGYAPPPQGYAPPQ